MIVRIPRFRTALLLGIVAASVGVAPLVRAQTTEFDGGVYLFRHQPVGMPDGEPTTEVYAVHGSAHHRTGPWTVFAELRARETRLREFFPSTVWVQEAWAAYSFEREDGDAAGVEGEVSSEEWTVRAGKIYRRTGRFWDGSFFGNVHYFDGLKLNPQFGLEAETHVEAVGVRWTGRTQLLLASDRISGALAGRDYETLSSFEERLGWSARATASGFGGWRAGATYLHERVVGPEDDPSESFVFPHLAFDLEWSSSVWTAYVEALRRWADSPGETEAGVRARSGAVYALFGVRRVLGPVELRYNVSRAAYRPSDEREWIHQPGFGARFSEHLSVLAEWTYWTARPRPEGTGPIDRSLSVVLHLRF